MANRHFLQYLAARHRVLDDYRGELIGSNRLEYRGEVVLECGGGAEVRSDRVEIAARSHQVPPQFPRPGWER